MLENRKRMGRKDLEETRTDKTFILSEWILRVNGRKASRKTSQDLVWNTR